MPTTHVSPNQIDSHRADGSSHAGSVHTTTTTLLPPEPGLPESFLVDYHRHPGSPLSTPTGLAFSGQRGPDKSGPTATTLPMTIVPPPTLADEPEHVGIAPYLANSHRPTPTCRVPSIQSPPRRPVYSRPDSSVSCPPDHAALLMPVPVHASPTLGTALPYADHHEPDRLACPAPCLTASTQPWVDMPRPPMSSPTTPTRSDGPASDRSTPPADPPLPARLLSPSQPDATTHNGPKADPACPTPLALPKRTQPARPPCPSRVPATQSAPTSLSRSVLTHPNQVFLDLLTRRVSARPRTCRLGKPHLANTLLPRPT